MKENLVLSTTFKFLIILTLGGCGHFFYAPNKVKYGDPKEFGINYNSGFFSSEDGTPLHYWHLKNKKSTPPKALVVHFHGNGMNLTNHFPSLAWLTEHDVDVLIWDYRGYGRSAGIPDHKAVYKDALSALEFSFKLKEKIGAKKIIAFGQSLGGMVLARSLVDFRLKSKIDLIVLDSTFSSYRQMAFSKMKESWLLTPFSPLAFVLFDDKFASKNTMHLFPNVKTLVMHGPNDKVVPYKFGEEIFKVLKSPKCFWAIEKVGHIEVFHGIARPYRKPFLKMIENPDDITACNNPLAEHT